jgi:hypothetical protein
LQLIAGLRKISDEVRSTLNQKDDGPEEESSSRATYRKFEKALKKAEMHRGGLEQLVEVLSSGAS